MEVATRQAILCGETGRLAIGTHRRMRNTAATTLRIPTSRCSVWRFE
jgi:hypothetical protein